MHLIWTILIGFLAGLVAKMLMPGRDPSGFFITAALGIGGSLAATYLGQALGLYQAGQSAGFIGAVIGAIVLLVIYHLVTKK
ncbi:MAG: GlsB/YeaQ/YmgE family stress response membrane protein [Rhizobacter sp.]